MAEHKTALGSFFAVMEDLNEIPNNVAKAVKKDAEELTPVNSGRLKKGYVLTPSTALGQTVEVINEVPYAGFIEFGTENIQPRAMVGQAALKVSADARKYLKDR